MSEVITYHHFSLGQEFVISEVVDLKEYEDDCIMYSLKLEGIDDMIKIIISPENKSLVKTGAIIFFSDNDNAKGYSVWRNGIGPYDIKVPKGACSSEP